MRSIIFSFKKRNFARNRRNFKLSISDMRYFLKKYGVTVLFTALLFVGIAAGSVYAGYCDKAMLDSLDFLFTTNFDSRLTQNAAETFCACFSSDFLFLLSIFLLGTAPWGIPIMPFVIFFKGFGTGLTAGYLFIAYSFKGAAFYLLILLCGTFLFCLALVLLSTSAFTISKQMFFAVISKKAQSAMRDSLSDYCSRSIFSLLMTFCAALIDAVLWTLFAGMFNF